MSSVPSERSGGASGVAATSRLTGQTCGAALTALCFALGGGEGPTIALGVGAAFAATGTIVSFLRLAAPKPED
jgi:DHA2 family multidrug resistance protein-like MFS transporter